MIPFLDRRQLGLVTEVQFKQKESNVRYKKLVPEMLSASNITSMDMELSCQRYLLSATSTGNLFLDDFVTNASLEHNETPPIFKSSHSIETVQFMWDFETFSTSGWDKTLRIFDVESLQVLASHKFEYEIAKHDLNASKHLCAVTGKKSCFLYDLKRQMVVDILGQDVRLTNLQWNKQNPNLLLVASEKGMFLWDIRRPRTFLVQYKHPHEEDLDQSPLFVGCTFTKDFSHIISFGTNGICLWDLTGKLKADLSYYSEKRFTRSIQLCLPSYPCKPELVFIPQKNNVLMVTLPDLKPFHCYKDSFKDITWIYNLPNSYNVITGSHYSETIIWKPKIKAKKNI
uniref:DNA excision repair protein ERCC-8 n=1 Tax=Cacopsylla melanoneura TaxID=428564 RepID=A0A8D8QMJ9_9HEMI